MEIEKLITALQESISLLQESESSGWANRSVEEIIQQLQAQVEKCTNSQGYDAALLAFLFAPTGAIQETALDNGWGNEYLRISEVIDQFTGSR